MTTPLLERNILLLEDETLLRYDISNSLRAAGAFVVPARSPGEALAVIERQELSAAILKVGVGEMDCSGVYERLLQRGTPVVLNTDFLPALVSRRWPKALVMTKAALRREVVSVIVQLCSSNQLVSDSLELDKDAAG